MNFKEKVQSMSGKEIVLAMVKALQNPKLKVRMYTFGEEENGICYGCAATNTICEIAEKTFDKYNINFQKYRSDFLNVDIEFLSNFEEAIEYLRRGYVIDYNIYAERVGFATLVDPKIKLPVLSDNYTKEDLQLYTDYANTL